MNRHNAAGQFTSRSYASQGGIEIRREVEEVEVSGASDYILERIDYQKGALFSSSYEYPGRYTQWDIGFIEPCLEIRARQKEFAIKALNPNGRKLLPPIYRCLASTAAVLDISYSKGVPVIYGRIMGAEGFFREEERSRQPGVFSVIRALQELLMAEEDRFLGLYGAFGYDLVFQFEPMELKRERSSDQWDLVLYLPDKLLVVDHRMGRAYRSDYSFGGASADEPWYAGEARSIISEPASVLPGHQGELAGRGQCAVREPLCALPEHQPGRYADKVKLAKKAFAQGELFEVVLSQSLYEPCPEPPSRVFASLRSINPSPYGFIINLGGEFLVGASPEMYVRVEGRRVETCPISGTVRRGKDALEDEVQIRELLNSGKDESELTMCTDVDRNDKSRICEPGSVRVIGRRQIELYSHVIHTVDHVEGCLREGFDALDAFLTHMWAVTVTGAPKRAAIQWLEENEDSARGWYGGAVGYFTFSGDLNTGLTLRTISMKSGMAQIRVGATLLYDSVPESEEAETYMKAAALKRALRSSHEFQATEPTEAGHLPGQGKKVLLVDHEDSFVHTLADYFRQSGARVEVIRWNLVAEVMKMTPDYNLVVLSPGPGRPADFNIDATIKCCLNQGIPIFGVCLGLQAIVEYFGGQLGVLGYPQHGKTGWVRILHPGSLWEELPPEFKVGRYHSLYAAAVTDCLKVSAVSQDNVVMAVEHRHLPVAAVQFHPESIMSARDDCGLRLIMNVTAHLAGRKKQSESLTG
ncbi:anthranilate synthase component I [Syntrophomonas curvata]